MELGWVSLNDFDWWNVFKMFARIKQQFHRLDHCKKIRKGKTPTWSTAASENRSGAAGGSEQLRAPGSGRSRSHLRCEAAPATPPALISSWPGRTRGMKRVSIPALETCPARWSWGPMVIPCLSTKRRRSSKNLGWFLASYPLQVFSYQMANPCPYPRNRLSHLQATSCGKSFIPIENKQTNKKIRNSNRDVI